MLYIPPLLNEPVRDLHLGFPEVQPSGAHTTPLPHVHTCRGSQACPPPPHPAFLGYRTNYFCAFLSVAMVDIRGHTEQAHARRRAEEKGASVGLVKHRTPGPANFLADL